mmetsp:Transcript_2119/g.5883  ORF Transcript_2119/g.5883 Transcript_2119/m.5883 type:complete len:307 (+) Transcript_2119:321-1241(+)
MLLHVLKAGRGVEARVPLRVLLDAGVPCPRHVTVALVALRGRVAVRSCLTGHSCARLEIELAELGQGGPAEQVVSAGVDAEPSHAGDVLNGLHRVCSRGSSAVLPLAHACIVRLAGVRVRPVRADKVRGLDLLNDSRVSLEDLHDGVLVPLHQVSPLVLLGSRVLEVAGQASELVPDEAFDTEPPLVVLLLQPVHAENVPQVLPPTLVVRGCGVRAAIVPVAVQREVGHQVLTPRCSFARLQEVVQPARVMCHGGAHELPVPLGGRGQHVGGPRLRVSLGICAQGLYAASLPRVIRLVPAFDGVPH